MKEGEVGEESIKRGGRRGMHIHDRAVHEFRNETIVVSREGGALILLVLLVFLQVLLGWVELSLLLMFVSFEI